MFIDLESALELGTDWLLRQGYAWTEDKEHCEEYGRMLTAGKSTLNPKPWPAKRQTRIANLLMLNPRP